MSISFFVPFIQTPSKTFIVPLVDRGNYQVFEVPTEAFHLFAPRVNKDVGISLVCSFTKQMGYITEKKYVRLIVYSNTAYGIYWQDRLTMQACDGPEEKSEK